jgi:septal ring factor EnvC (AmiA/AmiB activator)
MLHLIHSYTFTTVHCLFGPFSQLERKVQGLTRDKEEMEGQLVHIRTLNRRLETNLQVFENENQRLKGELGMAQEETDQKSASLHDYERKMETLEGQIRETTDDVDTLKGTFSYQFEHHSSIHLSPLPTSSPSPISCPRFDNNLFFCIRICVLDWKSHSHSVQEVGYRF